jgi:hypothetical protein
LGQNLKGTGSNDNKSTGSLAFSSNQQIPSSKTVIKEDKCCTEKNKRAHVAWCPLLCISKAVSVHVHLYHAVHTLILSTFVLRLDQNPFDCFPPCLMLKIHGSKLIFKNVCELSTHKLLHHYSRHWSNSSEQSRQKPLL